MEDFEKQKGQCRLQATRTGNTLHDKKRHVCHGPLFSVEGNWANIDVLSDTVLLRQITGVLDDFARPGDRLGDNFDRQGHPAKQGSERLLRSL